MRGGGSKRLSKLARKVRTVCVASASGHLDQVQALELSVRQQTLRSRQAQFAQHTRKSSALGGKRTVQGAQGNGSSQRHVLRDQLRIRQTFTHPCRTSHVGITMRFGACFNRVLLTDRR